MENQVQTFPLNAGILLGLGLGGFFDGIVLHQVLQWHHMFTSAGFPAITLDNLKFNTMWDGFFHVATWIFVVAGLLSLWRHSRLTHTVWSSRLLAGSLLLGFGLFNVVEGLIDHHIVGLHHVNETVPESLWIYWDIAFLIWGVVMIIAGWKIHAAGKRTAMTARSRTTAKDRSVRGASGPVLR